MIRRLFIPFRGNSIMKEIARGAEAVVREGKLLGMPVVVKERVRKGYRVPQLDERLRRLRTRGEARLLHEAKKAGVLCPVVYSVSDYELIMSRIEGKLLLEMAADGRLLRKTGEALAKLHGAGIAHGDFTTANVMVKRGSVWIIDFGLGGFSDALEEKAIDVLLMKRSLGDAKGYGVFLQGYRAYGDSAAVLEKLKEIEMRGRYVVRAMAR